MGGFLDTALAQATFVAFMCVLGCLALIVFFKGPHKLIKALDERATGIANELAEARRQRDEAQALLDTYKRRAKHADEEAAAILAQAKADATRLQEDAKAALDDLIARRTRAAEMKIAQAEAQALADVRGAATDLAIHAAKDVLAQRMATGAGARLIDASLDDVRARLGG